MPLGILCPGQGAQHPDMLSMLTGEPMPVTKRTGDKLIGATLNTISLLPDVLTAALVFHCTDEE